MRKLIKWTSLVLGGLVVVVILALGVTYLVSNSRMNQSYSVPSSFAALQSDSALVARGQHLATIRGCADCHGSNLGGQVFIDDPMLGRIAAANLTRGKGGNSNNFTDADWDRAIRHGVRTDGKPLLVMPSQEFNGLSDEDLSALIAYLKQLPPVDSDLPPSQVKPLARALYLAGQIQLVPAEVIDHTAIRPNAPAPGPTAEYGAYMAPTCTGCHGKSFAGGPIPGMPPDTPPAANLTPDHETGLGTWSEADFFRALREGKRPDGRMLNDFMPWRMTAQMTDDEIRALWLYFHTLPPVVSASKKS